MLTDRLNVVDLFSGCGGLSWGFRKAGWSHVYAVEKLLAPSRSYSANFHCPVWHGDVREFVKTLQNEGIVLPEVDAVVGGPPCQGFSPLGKMSAKAERIEHHSDLNGLWQSFAKTVELLQPSIVLSENVPQFHQSEEFEEYKETIRGLGYDHIAEGVLLASKFGVPQKRRRAFCLASRLGPIALPEPDPDTAIATVRRAIGKLPLVPDGKNWHIGRNPTAKSLERYAVVPPGGNRFDLMRERPDITPRCWLEKPTGSTDVFGRLEWDQPALTIRTEFFKPEKGCYLHPEANRPITHREAAALQTFPVEFEFRGSKTEVARQIGEAVPPRLAEAIARVAITHVRDHKSVPNAKAKQNGRSRRVAKKAH